MTRKRHAAVVVAHGGDAARRAMAHDGADGGGDAAPVGELEGACGMSSLQVASTREKTSLRIPTAHPLDALANRYDPALRDGGVTSTAASAAIPRVHDDASGPYLAAAGSTSQHVSETLGEREPLMAERLERLGVRVPEGVGLSAAAALRRHPPADAHRAVFGTKAAAAAARAAAAAAAAETRLLDGAAGLFSRATRRAACGSAQARASPRRSSAPMRGASLTPYAIGDPEELRVALGSAPDGAGVADQRARARPSPRGGAAGQRSLAHDRSGLGTGEVLPRRRRETAAQPYGVDARAVGADSAWATLRHGPHATPRSAPALEGGELTRGEEARIEATTGAAGRLSALHNRWRCRARGPRRIATNGSDDPR